MTNNWINDILAFNGHIICERCSIDTKSDIGPIRGNYCFNTKQPRQLIIVLRSVNSIDQKAGRCSRTAYIYHCSFEDMQYFSCPACKFFIITHTEILLALSSVYMRNSLLSAVTVVKMMIITLSMNFMVDLHYVLISISPFVRGPEIEDFIRPLPTIHYIVRWSLLQDTLPIHSQAIAVFRLLQRPLNRVHY